MPTNPPGYNRAYHARWRAKIVEQLGGKCSRCGDVHDLEIHHKVQTIEGRGRGRTRRLTDWKRNMDKLALLCPGCHDIETYGYP